MNLTSLLWRHGCRFTESGMEGGASVDGAFSCLRADPQSEWVKFGGQVNKSGFTSRWGDRGSRVGRLPCNWKVAGSSPGLDSLGRCVLGQDTSPVAYWW